MAKKKAKAAKKETPAKAQKKQSNSIGWVIAAIVVIIIIAFLALKGCQKAPAETTTTGPTTAEPEKGGITSAAAPEMEKKCTVVIGMVPGSKVVDGSNVAITFKNNGKVAIEGTYFEFSDEEGKVVYRKNSDSVAAGATVNFKLDLGQVGSELGIAIKKFVVYPVQDGKACENQRNIVIDYK